MAKSKKKKLVPQLDKFDLEAEREGQSIKQASETRVKKAEKKPKIKPVDARMLDEEFDRHYGHSGYTARGEDEDGNN